MFTLLIGAATFVFGLILWADVYPRLESGFLIAILMGIASSLAYRFWKSRWRTNEQPKDALDIGTVAFSKFKNHEKNAKSSLYILLTISAVSIIVVIFAQYFVVLDRYLVDQTARITFDGGRNSSACESALKYQELVTESATAYKERVDALTEDNVKRRREMIQQFSALANTQSERCDRQTSESSKIEKVGENPEFSVVTFWPVMTLRASVLAFVVFVMFFLIRNYQYDVLMSNRYFAVYSSIMADKKTAESVRENMKFFDASDIRFGPVKSSPVEDIVRLPRDIIDALKESRITSAEKLKSTKS